MLNSESDDESDDESYTMSESDDKNSKESFQLILLRYEDVALNSWVIVQYEEEKFVGRVIEKKVGQYKVQCLNMPYGI